VTRGQLGSSGTASIATDTGLLEPDANSLLPLDNLTKTDKTIKFQYRLPSTGGTATTYKEFELDRTSGTSILTNYDRIVFTGIAFTPSGTEDLNVSKKYFFKSV